MNLKKIRGILLPIHGMQEDVSRYLDFVKQLEELGLKVILPDLKGHGTRIPLGQMMDFQEQTNELIQLVKQESKSFDVPLICFGHSMGSLFARNILINEPDLFDFVILSGSPSYNPITPILSKSINIYSLLFKRQNSYNKLLNKQLIKQFNNKIKNPKTTHDWLSFNDDNVKYYLENPLCGFDFSNYSFVQLLRLMEAVNKKGKPQSNTLILFLSGKQDPCIDNKLDKTIEVVKSYGRPIKSIEYLYSRHEILFDNESDRVKDNIIEAIELFLENKPLKIDPYPQQ